MARGAPDFWLRGTRIDLIDLINKIKEISTIDVISQIRTLDFGYLGQFNVFKNTGFEVGDAEDPDIAVGWDDYLGKRFETIDAFAGKYCFLIEAYTTAWLQQTLEVPIICRRVTELSCKALDVSMVGVRLRFYAIYSDGTSDYHDFTLSSTYEWTYCNMTPYLDRNKLLKSIKFMNPDAEDVIMIDEVIGLASSEVNVISRKGLESKLYFKVEAVPADTIRILCDIPNKLVVIDTLEFSSNSKKARLRIFPYKEDGTLSFGIGTVTYDGTGYALFFDAECLDLYKSTIMELYVYDTTNDRYKFGLKRRIEFPNGVKIEFRNVETVTKNIACMVTVGIEGD